MNIFAQVPGKMTYQSLIRDNQSSLIQNRSVGLRITIVQDGISQTSVFEETHVTSTNINGLLTLEIGTGANNFGAIQSIDWNNGPYLIRTAIDPNGGSNYSIFGESPLLSVPYAMYANKADSSNHAPMDGNDSVFSGWDKNESDDFDAQYSSLVGAPSNVSAFVNDTGYLTTEIDGSTTNELQQISLVNDTLFLSHNGGSVPLHNNNPNGAPPIVKGPLSPLAFCPAGASYTSPGTPISPGIYNFTLFSCLGQIGISTPQSGFHIDLVFLSGSGDASRTFHNFNIGDCGHYYTGVIRVTTPSSIAVKYTSYQGSSFTVPSSTANTEYVEFWKISNM